MKNFSNYSKSPFQTHFHLSVLLCHLLVAGIVQYNIQVFLPGYVLWYTLPLGASITYLISLLLKGNKDIPSFPAIPMSGYLFGSVMAMISNFSPYGSIFILGPVIAVVLTITHLIAMRLFYGMYDTNRRWLWSRPLAWFVVTSYSLTVSWFYATYLLYSWWQLAILLAPIPLYYIALFLSKSLHPILAVIVGFLAHMIPIFFLIPTLTFTQVISVSLIGNTLTQGALYLDNISLSYSH